MEHGSFPVPAPRPPAVNHAHGSFVQDDAAHSELCSAIAQSLRNVGSQGEQRIPGGLYGIFAEELQRRIEYKLKRIPGKNLPYPAMEPLIHGIAGELVLAAGMLQPPLSQPETRYTRWNPGEDDARIGDLKFSLLPHGSIIIRRVRGDTERIMAEFDSALLTGNGELALLDACVSRYALAEKIHPSVADHYHCILATLQQQCITSTIVHVLIGSTLPMAARQRPYPCRILHVADEAVLKLIRAAQARLSALLARRLRQKFAILPPCSGPTPAANCEKST